MVIRMPPLIRALLAPLASRCLLPLRQRSAVSVSPDRDVRRPARRPGWWLVCLFAGLPAYAHDPGLSTADVRFTPETVEMTFAFAPADALQLARSGASPRDAAITDALWREVAAQWAEIRLGGREVSPLSLRIDTASDDAFRFLFVFPWTEGEAVELRVAGITRLPEAHRQYLVVRDQPGEPVLQKFLTRSEPAISFLDRRSDSDVPSQEIGHRFGSFLWLGIEHIWMGYDHLLFLLALVIVCRTFRSVVVVISCFTIAHSVTIAVATFGWFDLPPPLVEPAIAASIVYVAFENLLRLGAEPRGRGWVTFTFGLIHGFGFAGVLRELGVASMPGGATVPLLAFNLGVELGQIAIAAVALPVLWYLRRWRPFAQQGVVAISALVAVAGLYWLFDRTGAL